MPEGRQRAAPAPRGALPQLRELLEMIKFKHSLFALPFALIGMLTAARGLPDGRTVLLIVLAMVTARTAAMTWNRIADRDIDALNPRTRDRAIPAGRVGLAAAWALLVASVLLFVAVTAAINLATLALSPVALVILLGYSLTKRVTWATHFVLGAALGIAPAGAWIAVRGSLSPEPLWLALAVMVWTAGFDLLYSCMDADFDRERGIHSLPARFGIPTALSVSRACHVVAVVCFVTFGIVGQRGPVYFGAVLVATGVLAWSHSLVRAHDMSRVGLAFFEANVAVSLLLLAGTALDLFA